MKKIIFFFCFLTMFAGSAWATDKSGDGKKFPEMTTEQRGKMADLHEKMASCLRSDKPIKDCFKEMKQGCKDTMGKGGCPMMGHGKHHQDKDE